MENPSNESTIAAQTNHPLTMETENPESETKATSEGVKTRSQNSVLHSNWRATHYASRPPRSLPTKFVQHADSDADASTIPLPEDVSAEITQNSITTSENSENDFEMLGNSLVANTLSNPLNDDTNLKILVKIYREKMKSKMRISNLFNEWPAYHKQVVEELTSEFYLQTNSLIIHDLGILLEELNKELDYILEIQQLNFLSVETTCRAIGGRLRHDFFQNLYKTLTLDNLQHIGEIAIQMRNFRIDSELAILQKTNTDVKFLKTLIDEETKDCVTSIEQIKEAINDFKKLMTDRFKYSECFSDTMLDDYIELAVNSSVGHCTDHPGLLVRIFATEICDRFITPQFVKLNKEIQAKEKEIILQVLKIYYKKEMENFLPTNRFRRESDLRQLHAKIISDITDVLNNNKFDPSRNNLDVHQLLMELENEFKELYIVKNEIKMLEVINTMKNTISNLEIEFCEIITENISHDIVSDTEFEVLQEKTKHHVLDRLTKKINLLCPEEDTTNGRYVNWLNLLIQGHFHRLKTENATRVFQREKEGIKGPILVIQFGTTHLKVAIQHNKEFFQNVHIETKPEMLNMVTFLKNNQLIVGQQTNLSKDILNQVYIEDLLTNPKHFTSIRLQNGKILPVNLKFISSLIFTYLKEKCENGNESALETVVLTVPLWFGSNERQDIKDAASIAGFKQSFLINDTSALALNIFSQRLQFDSAEKKYKQHLAVVSIDQHVSYSAIYSFNEDEVVSMVTNYGHCHLPIETSKWGMSRPDPVHIAVIKNTLKLDTAKKIKFGILICRSEPTKKDCEKEFMSLKKGISFLFHDDGVLQGSGKYAQILMGQILKAKQAVQDKTYYDLCIDDACAVNRKVVNRLTNCVSLACNPSTPSKYIFPENSGKIMVYEDSNHFRKLIEKIEGKGGEPVKINYFTNNEGVFSVSAYPGTLICSNSRQENLKHYKKLIVDNFVPDKELESLKHELHATAEYILQNIQKVNGVFREDTEIDAKNAISLLQDQNASKEKIIEAMNDLKIVQKQIKPLQ